MLKISTLPMLPKKYVVSLIVESCYSPSFVIGISRKQTGEHSANGYSEPSVEIDNVHFWCMVSHLSNFLSKRMKFEQINIIVAYNAYQINFNEHTYFTFLMVIGEK